MEHAEPELERTARRLRRALLAVRVVFYASVVLIGVPVLIGRGDADGPTWLTGTTSQGEVFELRIDPGGEPGRLATYFKTTCSDSRPSGAAWRPYGPFRLKDDTLTKRETSERSYEGVRWQRSVTLRARVTDGSVSGTMELVERVDDPAYRPYACESGPVTFSGKKRTL